MSPEPEERKCAGALAYFPQYYNVHLQLDAGRGRTELMFLFTIYFRCSHKYLLRSVVEWNEDEKKQQ